MTHPLFFATLEPLRGLGIESKHENFHLVCFDYTQVVDMLIEEGIQVFCLEKELESSSAIPHTTRHLLLHPKTQEYLETNSVDVLDIAVFKPTFDIKLVLGNAPIGQTRVIQSFNASTVLSKKLENKLYFFDLCYQNSIPHTPATKMLLHKLTPTLFKTMHTENLVVQFETGWFGNRTFFINNEYELMELIKGYSDRTVLIAPFIDGTVLTNNFVVTDKDVLQSYPFFQLNDDSDHEVRLSRLQGSTIGNVWEGLESRFTENASAIASEIRKLTNAVGAVLQEQGFRGYAGLDFIVSENSKVYVQELNPRFTASVQMFTLLEQATFGTSLLEEHFGISNMSQPETYFKPLQGARIIARNTTTSAIRIAENIPNGIYTLEHDETYTFKRPSYRVTDLKGNEFLLFTGGENKEIRPDEEILQVQSTAIPVDKLQSLARNLKSSLLQ